MQLYLDWCACAEEVTARKHLWLLTEKAGSRVQIWAVRLETVRINCDHPGHTAADVARLGYEKAEEILRTQ